METPRSQGRAAILLRFGPPSFSFDSTIAASEVVPSTGGTQSQIRAAQSITGWPGAVARTPAPTERSVQISRTTLVRSCFTARR